MKAIVIYFSQSGNTKKMARAIRAGMQTIVDECMSKSMEHTRPEELVDYDLIGIGSPVWNGVPFPVMRFMKAWPKLKGKHCFTFATHGAKGERYLPNMVRLLGKKGLSVIGMRDWYASVSHPLFPKPYLTDGHPDETDLKEAEEFGREMAEVARKIHAGEAVLLPEVPPMLPPRTLKRPRTRKRLDLAKCRYPECRLCMDHCRLKIIDLSASPPVFPEKCEPCYFCELICPTGAIEADYSRDSKLETGRARVLFTEALDKAEAEGRFRRLVPVDKVGWNTPYYTVFHSHPRYVIPADDESDD